jgi:hypothetical protein
MLKSPFGRPTIITGRNPGLRSVISAFQLRATMASQADIKTQAVLDESELGEGKM